MPALTRRVLSIALLAFLSVPAFAQEWVEFASREDRFTCNFPSQPNITQTTYTSDHGAGLPARVYSASQGQSRYSVTVVDFNPIEKLRRRKRSRAPRGRSRVSAAGPGESAIGRAICAARSSTPPGSSCNGT